MTSSGQNFNCEVGATSLIVEVFIENSASPGTGKTGLAFNTGSLTAYLKRDQDNASIAITLVTATLGTFTSGGFKEVDATHMPGVYEIGIPNSALVTGARTVTVMLQGASGMLPCMFTIQLGASLTPTERTAIATNLYTQAMTEDYATNGSAPTLQQILCMIWSGIANFSISGTTITSQKLDRTTTAMTFNLNSSSTPTSRERAS